MPSTDILGPTMTDHLDSRARSTSVRVALVRHGETDWNVEGRLQGSSDIPLNDIGRSQARTAAAALADDSWDTLVSSPLSRASETADIIGHVIGLTRSADHEDLMERRFGRAEGMTGYEAWAYWPDGDYPGAESHDALAERGRRRLDLLADENPGRSLVAVAHGGIIRAVLRSITGHPAPRIANAGVSIVVRDDDGWSVRTVNSVPVRHGRRLR